MDQEKYGLSPRVRGNHVDQKQSRPNMGSIPARAGNPPNALRPTPCLRSIPARAGEPSGAGGRCRCFPVYPRACGGTYTGNGAVVAAQGLSPRVRGNPLRFLRFIRDRGSIPARAGEPPCRSMRRPPRTVYPRACGGTRGPSSAPPCCPGLSPRVRGNLGRYEQGDVGTGSIPARAGEPWSRASSRSPRWVYPRACGGT